MNRLFGFFLVTTLALVGNSSGSFADLIYPLPDRGLCAHRGAMATHPENTLPAFLEAIRVGAHMIEFDVQASRDGELVLMHDGTVDRTTDGSGKVSDLTLEELQHLDAGIKKDPQFRGTRIPTLLETLAIMPGNVWLNVHLKGGEGPALQVAEILIRLKRQHQAFIACGADAAKAVHLRYPEILICNMERQSDSMEYARQTIDHHHSFIQLLGQDAVVSPSVIQELKDHQVRINYFSAKTPEQLLQLFYEGIDFPLVNDVSLMMDTARESGILPLKPIPFSNESNP